MAGVGCQGVRQFPRFLLHNSILFGQPQTGNQPNDYGNHVADKDFICHRQMKLLPRTNLGYIDI